MNPFHEIAVQSTIFFLPLVIWYNQAQEKNRGVCIGRNREKMIVSKVNYYLFTKSLPTPILLFFSRGDMTWA